MKKITFAYKSALFTLRMSMCMANDTQKHSGRLSQLYTRMWASKRDYRHIYTSGTRENIFS